MLGSESVHSMAYILFNIHLLHHAADLHASAGGERKACNKVCCKLYAHEYRLCRCTDNFSAGKREESVT